MSLDFDWQVQQESLRQEMARLRDEASVRSSRLAAQDESVSQQRREGLAEIQRADDQARSAWDETVAQHQHELDELARKRAEADARLAKFRNVAKSSKLKAAAAFMKAGRGGLGAFGGSPGSSGAGSPGSGSAAGPGSPGGSLLQQAQAAAAADPARFQQQPQSPGGSLLQQAQAAAAADPARFQPQQQPQSPGSGLQSAPLQSQPPPAALQMAALQQQHQLQQQALAAQHVQAGTPLAAQQQQNHALLQHQMQQQQALVAAQQQQQQQQQPHYYQEQERWDPSPEWASCRRPSGERDGHMVHRQRPTMRVRRRPSMVARVAFHAGTVSRYTE